MQPQSYFVGQWILNDEKLSNMAEAAGGQKHLDRRDMSDVPGPKQMPSIEQAADAVARRRQQRRRTAPVRFEHHAEVPNGGIAQFRSNLGHFRVAQSEGAKTQALARQRTVRRASLGTSGLVEFCLAFERRLPHKNVHNTDVTLSYSLEGKCLILFVNFSSTRCSIIYVLIAYIYKRLLFSCHINFSADR